MYIIICVRGSQRTATRWTQPSLVPCPTRRLNDSQGCCQELEAVAESCVETTAAVTAADSALKADLISHPHRTKSLSHSVVYDSLWPYGTVAHQAPLSMGFSRQEFWSGLPCPPPGDLPNLGIKAVSLMSPVLADRFFTTSAIWEAYRKRIGGQFWKNVSTLR